jgi:hypothetical protein
MSDRARRDGRNEKTCHRLEVGEFVAVFKGGESVAAHDTVQLIMCAPLRLREQDHGHHPPSEHPDSSLAA